MANLGDTQRNIAIPTVMVIDDSKVACQLACAILEPLGYRVIVQLGPHGAVPTIEREQPSLLLVDVNMPAMMGDQVVHYLRRHSRREIPILLYSERSREELEALCVQCGAVGYVQKVDARETLATEVQRWAPLP